MCETSLQKYSGFNQKDAEKTCVKLADYGLETEMKETEMKETEMKVMETDVRN